MELDSLTEHYGPLLEGVYDCIDRIVLNAYCPMLLIAGGLRNWYRMMKGTDDISTGTLMNFAGRFSRRVKNYCNKEGVPLVYFRPGERKSEHAERLKPKDRGAEGIFAVFVSRAPSLLWEVKHFGNKSIDIRRKQKTSLVNHYYIHIMDRFWGHIVIRMCAHPPFTSNIILNGHEWVERHRHYAQLNATKQGNCFTSYDNGKRLTQIAETLKTKGQLEQVCQRWIYSCLWFVMDAKQQRDTGFNYNFSIYQIEYSRNLLFKRGRQMDAVYQTIIDQTRCDLDIKRLKTIFGKKRRPYNHKSTAPAPKVCIETPDYNLTVFKIHFGRLTVKLYDKGDRTLRAEVVVHNTKDLKCKRGLDSFGQITEKLETIMGSFLSNINYAHIATIDDGTFEQVAQPTQQGDTRLAGVNFNSKRIRQVAVVLLALSVKPGGFTSKDLCDQIRARFNPNYTCRNASYDLRKFRGKHLVTKLKGRIRYVTTMKGTSTIAAILCLMTKQMPALVTVTNSAYNQIETNHLAEMDKHLFLIQQQCDQLRQLNGIKFAA